MARDLFERRRRTRLVLGVLAVAIVMSALLAVALFYMGQMHPGS